MTPERWQKVDKLLKQALEQDPGSRGSFLNQACAGDEELRHEVQSLLVHENQGQHLLERSALQVMADRLASESPWLARHWGRTKSSHSWALAAWERYTMLATAS